MSKAEKYLPIVLSLFLPGFNISNNYDLSTLDWGMLLPRYLEASTLLLMLWYFNQWLVSGTGFVERVRSKNWVVAVGNLLLLSFLLLIDSVFIPEGLTSLVSYRSFFFRMTMVVLLFNVILRAFKSHRERESLKVQNLSLQAENLKFQMETMKQQINPHFLFNSLNTLMDLIEENSKQAAKYVRHFSNLYRVVLMSSQRDFIHLEDELKFLNDYWNLLKMRFSQEIELTIDIPQAKLTYLIPPLSLQFLIENAVKHNSVSKETPLRISIYEKENLLIVENKILPKAYPVAGEKLGMKNLQKRFSLLHEPIEYGEVNGYYKVSLPLKPV